MGLDDFITEKEYSVGNVKSRKEVSNITIDEKQWIHIFYNEPDYAYYLASYASKTEMKAFIELLDKIIQGEVDDIDLSEEKRDEIQTKRDMIVAEELR